MKLRIAIIIALLSIAGCESSPQSTYLKVEPDNILVSKDGGTFDIRIDCDSYWVTDNTASWISIRKKDGNASVSVDPNEGADRSRTIAFQSGELTAFLEIIQEHSDIFSLSASSFHSSYKGETFLLNIECYDSWTAECPDEWITLSQSEGNCPESVSISIAPNSDKEDRTGHITFSCGDRTIVVTVTQGPSPFIALEKSEVSIDGDGGVLHILYLSNTAVEIVTDDEWIRMIDLGTEEKTIAIEVLRNLSDAREGHITVTAKADREYYKVLTVKQGEKIDHPAISFEEGHEMEIAGKGSFRLHPVFEDMKDTALEWDSDNPSIASVDNDGNVTVYTSGVCTVTAVNRHHGIEASIVLNVRIKASSIKVFLGTQDMEKNTLAVRFPGEVIDVNIIMDPEEAYTGDLVCISSDPGVARIDGMSIRCIQPGSADITVESLYHGIRKSFSMFILED